MEFAVAAGREATERREEGGRRVVGTKGDDWPPEVAAEVKSVSSVDGGIEEVTVDLAGAESGEVVMGDDDNLTAAVVVNEGEGVPSNTPSSKVSVVVLLNKFDVEEDASTVGDVIVLMVVEVLVVMMEEGIFESVEIMEFVSVVKVASALKIESPSMADFDNELPSSSAAIIGWFWFVADLLRESTLCGLNSCALTPATDR